MIVLLFPLHPWNKSSWGPAPKHKVFLTWSWNRLVPPAPVWKSSGWWKNWHKRVTRISKVVIQPTPSAVNKQTPFPNHHNHHHPQHLGGGAVGWGWTGMSSRVDGDDGGAKPSATKLLKTFSKCGIYKTKKLSPPIFSFSKCVINKTWRWRWVRRGEGWRLASRMLRSCPSSGLDWALLYNGNPLAPPPSPLASILLGSPIIGLSHLWHPNQLEW